ncbi:MAG: LOG family protein, partial [Acidobacteriota bacterium]
RLDTVLAGRPAIAVFGSGEPTPGDPAYAAAREAGERLAKAGVAVVTGGYGGVMEAASRGAREAGGLAIGVTVEAFGDRARPNRWLTSEIPTPDLFVRTRTLIAATAGALVMSGKAGTLAEVSFLWALHRARLVGDHLVVLVGEAWQPAFRALCDAGIVAGRPMEYTRLVGDVQAGVALLLEKME